jgi:hypothetical protein
LKSGNLNLLESYGPVQTCNGIALPLYEHNNNNNNNILPLNKPNQVSFGRE